MTRAQPHLRTRFAIAAACVFVVLAACANLLQINGAPTNICETCVTSSCPTEMAACNADTACSHYESCLLGCGGDYVCRSQCLQGYLPASEAIPIVDQCESKNCSEACGLACGTTTMATGPTGTDLCKTCVVASACTEAEACASELTCFQLFDCWGGCSTPDCKSACVAEFQGGADAANAFVSKIGGECGAACQIGDHWHCIGNVQFPLPTVNTIALTITVISETTLRPLDSSVSVLACSVTDPDCSAPIAAASTDDQGIAEVSLPAGGGFQGHLDLSADGQLPEHVFFAYPITEANAFTNAVMIPFDGGLGGEYGGNRPDTVAGRGIILVSTQDCALVPAANVVVAASNTDDISKTLYVSNFSLTPDAAATDSTSIAAIVNVPAGNTILTATPLPAGQVSSRVPIFVTDGGISYVTLYPNVGPPSH